MQLWLKKHNIGDHDRTAHELRSLVEIVYLGGSYDQLNLPSLASFEAATRRIMTIVEAFSSTTSSGPEWGHARLFTGSYSPDDLVSPDLRSWAAKRGKEEVELLAARQKMKDAKKGLAADGEASDVAGRDGLPGGGGRGRGRGRSSRGLEIPAGQ